MRQKLPNRRPSRIFTFSFKGHTFVANLGYYTNPTRLGEIFIRCGKSGYDAEIWMLETAVAVSFALQNGATVEDMRSAMPRRANGEAEGPVGTLLDLLAGEDLKEAELELLR